MKLFNCPIKSIKTHKF